MASFFSFLRQKKYPSIEHVKGMLRGPLTKQSAILCALLAAILVLAYTLIISINDRFLVTVPARGGNVTEGIIGAPRYIHPIVAQTDTDISLAKLIYAGLMKMEADGSIVPELTDSFVLSPDGKTYTFTLRDNVTFHDGAPLTSQDIVFTLSALQDPLLNPTESDYWRTVRAEAINDQIVLIHIPEEDKRFLEKMTFGILPKHVWESAPSVTWVEKSETMIPVGSGAFSITSIRKENGVIKELFFKRNKSYALGKPYLDTLRIVSYPNQDSLRNAISSGSVDITLALDTDTLALNPLSKRVIISEVATLEAVALYRNTNESTLSNAALVPILNRFIDKDAIIATVEHGYGTLEEPSDVSSLDSTLEALQSIGFISKDGVLMKNGNPVGFSIAVSNDSHDLAAARMLANALGSLGMIISVKAFDQGTFQDDIALSQYNVVLASTTKETISSAYRKVLMLYTRTLPYAANENVHGVIPKELQSPTLRYSNSKDWYTKTDRIWKWLTDNDTK